MKKLILPIFLLVSPVFAKEAKPKEVKPKMDFELELNATSHFVKAFQINGMKFKSGHLIDREYDEKCDRIKTILASEKPVLMLEGYYFKKEATPRLFEKALYIDLRDLKKVDIEDFDYKKLGTNKPAVKIEMEYKGKGEREVKQEYMLKEVKEKSVLHEVKPVK